MKTIILSICLIALPSFAKMKWYVVEPSPGKAEIIGVNGFTPSYKILHDAPLDNQGNVVTDISETVKARVEVPDPESPGNTIMVDRYVFDASKRAVKEIEREAAEQDRQARNGKREQFKTDLLSCVTTLAGTPTQLEIKNCLLAVIKEKMADRIPIGDL